MLKKLSFFEVFLTACIFLTATVIVRNSSQIIDLVNQQSADKWLYFGVFTSLSALIITLFYRAISSRYAETKTGIRYISISFFIVSVICYLVLSLQTQGGTDYQTSLALFVSSSLLGAGWWVQATINSAAARKSHTVNTVMNHRYSEFFFKRSDHFSNMFPVGTVINPAVIECAFTRDKSRYKDIDFDKDMIQAAKDLNYIMNFYEFIAVGVNSGDFDEKLIRECYEGIIIGMEKRGFHMIQHMRRTQGQKVFCSLVELVDKWTTNQSMTTQYKNGSQNVDLGNLTPSQEFVDAKLRDRANESASQAHVGAKAESNAQLGKGEPHAQLDKVESNGQPDNVTPIDAAHHAGSGEPGGPKA